MTRSSTTPQRTAPTTDHRSRRVGLTGENLRAYEAVLDEAYRDAGMTRPKPAHPILAFLLGFAVLALFAAAVIVAGFTGVLSPAPTP